MVKRLPAMWETWVWSLGREDPLEKEMATHSSTFAWKIPWTEEAGRLQSMGSQSWTWLSKITWCCITHFESLSCSAACQASLSFTVSQSLLKLMSIELVMLSNHLILWWPLLLPSVFPSIRFFSNELALCIRWPKDWSFSFSISPSNEYSGLISFRMDWFDLLADQGTLKNLLQHHSSKHQFFSAQPSLWSNFHIITRLMEKP